jgi:hypothetical protein
MIYKLHAGGEGNQTTAIQAAVDMRVDDTIEQVMLSASVFVDDESHPLPVSFTAELSFLPTAQVDTNDTQGQIVTLHFANGEVFVDSSPSIVMAGSGPFDRQVLLPIPGGLKVQSGERLYLNLVPEGNWEGKTIKATATIFTKAGGTDRAIRRR